MQTVWLWQPVLLTSPLVCPLLILFLISSTAVIPAVLSRKLYNKFVSPAKVAANSLKASGSLRGSSSVRPLGWWVPAKSGALSLRRMVHWNSPLSVHLSHLSFPCHVISSSSIGTILSTGIISVITLGPIALDWYPRVGGCSSWLCEGNMGINLSWLTTYIVPQASNCPSHHLC